MDKQGTIYSTTMNGGANVSGTISS